MGQRAHNRRHEGRAIRQQRRQFRSVLTALPRLAEALATFSAVLLSEFARTAADVGQTFIRFSEAFNGEVEEEKQEEEEEAALRGPH